MRPDPGAAKPAPLSQRLFSARSYPIHYLVIPKCGCTFVKNLLWQLDQGAGHGNPIRVHDSDDQFLRASELGLSVEEISARRAVFTVLRNPVERFYSLYTDKVVGRGHARYVPLRASLVKNHGLNPDANTVEAHRENCEILIEWIARNLKTPQEIDNDPHWTPQIYRKNIFKTFDLKLLLLPQLNNQLQALLDGIVPDIGGVLKGLERNRSAVIFPKQEVLDGPLRKRINEVYGGDRKLFNAARQAWDQITPGQTSPDAFPRFSDLELG